MPEYTLFHVQKKNIILINNCFQLISIPEITYSRFLINHSVIDRTGLHMDKGKIRAIIDTTPPTNVKMSRHFWAW